MAESTDEIAGHRGPYHILPTAPRTATVATKRGCTALWSHLTWPCASLKMEPPGWAAPLATHGARHEGPSAGTEKYLVALRSGRQPRQRALARFQLARAQIVVRGSATLRATATTTTITMRSGEFVSSLAGGSVRGSDDDDDDGDRARALSYLWGRGQRCGAARDADGDHPNKDDDPSFSYNRKKERRPQWRHQLLSARPFFQGAGIAAAPAD